MAAVADLRRRFGVGGGGIVLYLVLFGGGVAVAELLGDIPTSPGQGVSLQVWVPGLVFGLGLLGVALAAGNLPTYLRLVRGDTPGTGDAASASGRVVLEGTVESTAGTLTTPFTGRPAVAYTTRVLKNEVDDVDDAEESEKNWSAVHVGDDATRFGIDDGSGSVVVDPGGARFYLQDSEEQFFPAGTDIPASVRESLAAADIGAAGAHLRVEETTLEPGEEGFAVGRPADAAVEATLVAEGDHATRLRDRVLKGGSYGAVVAAVGYLGLLLVAGVV